MRTHFVAWGLVAFGLLIYSFPAYNQTDPAEDQVESASAQAQAQVESASAQAQAEAERLAQAARLEADDGPIEVAPALPVAQATSENQPPAEKKNGVISFNNAELPIVLKYIHDKSGKPVVKGQGLDGKKVHLINTKELTDRENLNLLYRVLASQGIVVVESDDFIEVLTQEDARKTDMPVVDTLPADSEIEQPVVYFHVFQNIRNKKVVDQLKPLVRDPEALIYDEGSKTIFYTDTRSYVEKLARLVEMIDREPLGKMTTVAKTIRYASAAEVHQSAQDFLKMYASLAQGGDPKTVVNLDTASNTLFLRGPSNEVEALSATIDILDATTRTREFFVGSPEDLVPLAIALLLEEMAELGKPNYEHSIRWERDTFKPNIVRFFAPSSELDVLLPFLDELDPPLFVQRYTVANAIPEDLVPLAVERLEQYFVDNNRPDYQPLTRIRIDRRGESLVLRGPAEELSALQTILAELDAAQWQHKSVTTRTFALGYAKAEDLIAAARDYLAARVAFEGRPGDEPGVSYKISPETNSIVLHGASTQLAIVIEVMNEVEKNSRQGRKPIVVYPKFTAASQLYSELTETLSGVFSGPGAPIVQTNDRLGVVILTAREQDLPVVKEWIERLDVPAQQNFTRELVRLKNADPNALSTLLSQLVSTGGRIIPDTRSNSLLIIDSTESIQRMKPFIDQLDTPETAGGEIRFYRFRYTEAGRLGNEIGRLFRQRGRRRSDGRETEIVADAFTNTLLAVGSEADMKRLDELVEKLDVEGAGGRQIRVIPLVGVNARQLASGLRNLRGPNGSLSADETTNSLIIDDTPAVIEKIEEVAAELNVRGGEITAHVRALEYADASALVSPLQQYISLKAAQEGNRRPRLSISAETSTNAVLIFGPTSEIQLIDELIDELDTEDLAKYVPRIYALEHIQATQIASQIQQILTQTSVGPVQPVVVAEPTTNSLIVQAPQADLERVGKLLEDLDRPESGGLEVEVITLRNSSALDLARTLRSPPLSRRGSAFADRSTNSIVITDTPAAIGRVRDLIAKLDSEERETVYRVQRLENTPVAILQNQIEQFLTHLAQLKGLTRPLTDIITDPISNSVVIYGPSDEAELVMDLLIELDNESLRERHAEVRPLERAQATKTAPELSQLLSQIITGPNAPRIVANEETNSLLILATPADMNLIDELIEALDADAEGLRRARVYPLEYADANTILPTLRGLVGPTAEISAHADSNSIVYTDTEANIDKVFRLIEELDLGSRMEDVVSKVVPLENTDALAVTTPLQTIVSQVNAFQQRGNKPPVHISPQIEANAVLIVGARDDVDQLAQIVLQLDAESFYDREPAFFLLEWARAEEVSQELTQLFTQSREYGMVPRIVANDWANALMVMADPRDLETIEQLVKQLDTREGRQRVIEIFVLKNAEAYQLAPHLQELFQGGTTRTGSGGRGRGGYPYYYYGGRQARAVTTGQVSIVADQRLNALIVTAEPQDMEQVVVMIEALDIESPFSEKPRVYNLENAEAEDVAATLSELFSDTDAVQGRYYSYDREVSVSGLSGRIRVLSVPQTNQLIVLASSPRAFDVVEEMIEELDQPSVQAGRTQTIRVKHADVVSLKKTLDSLFKRDENQGRGGAGFLFNIFDFGGGFGSGGSFSNLIGKVRIEADTRTSTLLVVTPELYFPDVKELIARLDVPTKQVLLRVLIAELTRNNERDLGIQWGVDPSSGRVGSVAIDNQEVFNFDNDRGAFINPFTDPSGFFLGNSLTDAAQFHTLNSSQFGIVLNFLQTCQDIKIKQNPSITGADNEMASIRVGRQTPFVSDIDQSAGQVTSSVEYRDLGLTLEVTPHVESSTQVSLLISVTDGDIDPSVPLLLNSAATFTDREIKTRAFVEDRHTIVLGGIISEEVREVIDEVPFLSRIPWVGDKFFRNRNNVRETFEILIFITPYILDDGVDSQVATEMYRQKSKDPGLMEIDMEKGGWLYEEEDELRRIHAQRREEREDLSFEEYPGQSIREDPWRVR